SPTIINPEFDASALTNPPKTEGDVPYTYSGDPTNVVNNPSLIANKFIDNRPWYAKGVWGQLLRTGQPDEASRLNNQLAANTTQAQINNRMAQDLAIQNAAVPNTTLARGD